MSQLKFIHHLDQRDYRDLQQLHIMSSGGEAFATLQNSILDPYHATLSNVSVEGKGRGRGYGSALMAEIDRCAEVFQFHTISLTVNHANQSFVEGFYLRRGWERQESEASEGFTMTKIYKL